MKPISPVQPLPLRPLTLLLACLLIAVLPSAASAIDGDIIESFMDVTPGVAQNDDDAGEGMALVRDVGGPGVHALAVGRPGADGGAFQAGAVDLLFLGVDGGVTSTLEISEASGADPANVLSLVFGDAFGTSVASLGAVDGGSRIRIAVGATGTDSSAGSLSGAVWIVDLNAGTGVPEAAVRVTDGEGGLDVGTLAGGDEFGSSVAALGDWDGNGVVDLAVGAYRADDGASDAGAIHLLYLEADGTVRAQQRIGASQIGGGLPNFSRFGAGLAAIGDQNADGRTDLAVGAASTSADGSVWLLLMAPGCFAATPVCTVDGEIEITAGTLGFSGTLGSSSGFGESLDWMAASSPLDFDRLLVGASGLTANDTGGVWLLDLRDGVISASRLVGDLEGWSVDLMSSDQLGAGVASLGDVDQDGITDFAMGARGTPSTTGTVYTALVSACPSLILRPVVYHNPNDEAQDPCAPVVLPDDPTVTLNLYIESGGVASPVAACDDAEGGGTEMCAWDVRIALDGAYSLISFTPAVTGAEVSDLGAMPDELRVNWIGPATPQNGAVRLGTLVIANAGSGDGVVRVAPGSAAVGASLQLQTIGARTLAVPEPGPFGLVIGVGALAALVGARRRGRPGSRRNTPVPGRLVVTGVAYLLAISFALGVATPSRAVDSIKRQIRISEGESGFPVSVGLVATSLGASLAAPGDLDADGTPDLVFGCCSISGLFPNARLYSEFLDDTGSPAGPPAEIQSFSGQLFAHAMTAIPDRDGDGRRDLLIGTPTVGSGFPDQVSMIFLNADGTRKGTRIVYGAGGLGGFGGVITASDFDGFGAGVAWLGDVNGDPSTQEFAVGAPFYDGTISNAGSVWILSIDATNTVTSEQRILAGDLGLAESMSFGSAVAALGDLDDNGTNDLAIAAPSCVTASVLGCLYIVRLAPNGSGGVQAIATTVLGEGSGGLPNPLGGNFRVESLAWLGDLEGGEGGVLAIGDAATAAGELMLAHLLADGTVRDFYRIAEGAGVGETLGTPFGDSGFGSSVVAPGDLDGDEVPDLVVGAEDAQAARGGVGSVGEGAVFIFQMIDSDFDGLDDNLDNCPGGPGIDPQLSFNPMQADTDGDGVGDLCDVCPTVPDPLQGDVDGDREGDLCEPVVLSLLPTGTPSSPSWDVSIECGAYAVVESNVAVIPPASGPSPAFALTCSSPPPGGQCATLDTASSSVSGTGLVSPPGVRNDAFYLQLVGNGTGGALCQPLDPPSKVGELTTGTITGTSVAAASLTEEGVGSPGLGLALAADGSGAIALTETRLVTGDPLPRVTLELGPALVDGGNTRWDVLLRGASDRFHRVAFGLVAPFGTTTADMRLVGCDGTTMEPGDVRTCSTGVGPTVDPGQSWTVGPSTPGDTPAGLRAHTMYVVAEGAVPLGIFLPYLNFPDQTILLGTVELTGSPDLEPSLILEGVDLIDDRPGPGTIVPFERSVAGPVTDLDEVQLVGQFNPAEDVDGDGIQDLADNCPFSQNVDQADDGGFQTTDPDAKGNACQCGDGSGDGIIDPAILTLEDDLAEIRNLLLGRITTPLIRAEVEARCSVVGTPECNIRDLVVLQQALEVATPSAPRCDASLAPAAGS